MGRPRKPYSRESDQMLVVRRFNGRTSSLAKGRNNKAAALRKFHELHCFGRQEPQSRQAANTPSLPSSTFTSPSPRSATASGRSTSGSHYLQAVRRGPRLAGNDQDCRPFHLTAWLDAHPQWKSDWTMAQIINTVQRPFNWAVQAATASGQSLPWRYHRRR